MRSRLGRFVLTTGPLVLAAVLLPKRAEVAGGVTNCSNGQCHAEYRQLELAHAPVAAGVCRICHRPSNAGDHEFRLARDGAGLCASCHPEIDTAPNAHLDFWPGGCTICHDPHGTGHRFMLSAPQVRDACRGCHENVLAGDTLHSPVAAESCIICHDPHESAADALATGAERCFACHEESRVTWSGLAHLHEPVAAGDCGGCHDPHGSDDAAHLRQSVPDLCYGCHDDIRERVESSPHKHSVASEPGGCVVCHAPHGSSLSDGLRTDPFTLCVECHAPIAGELETSRHLHGPVAQRDCGGCHDVHGSEHPALLIERYTDEFYAPFDVDQYRLCFTCHPQRKILTERSTALTGFRNGDLNLHYLHVNRAEQGRTCRACHATHGSDEPKHIRAWVRYGSWKLPINFEKTGTGGSCNSGCHRPLAYDRETPVIYDTLLEGGQ